MNIPALAFAAQSAWVVAVGEAPSKFDQAAVLAELSIKLLSELRDKQILPPNSSPDRDFTDMMAAALRQGKVRFEVETVFGLQMVPISYFQDRNVIGIKLAPGQKIVSLTNEQKSQLSHELYHAFQDAAKLKQRKVSEVEGPALMLEIRHRLMSNGVRSYSSKAVALLLAQGYEAGQTKWFMSLDSKQLESLIKGALTNDRQEWDRISVEIGRYYVELNLLGELLAVADQWAGNGREEKGALYPLRSGENLFIKGEALVRLSELSMRVGRATYYREAPSAINAKAAALMSFWHEAVCVPNSVAVASYDNYTLPFDGVGF